MTVATAKRGRPKGTGLDDSRHLSAIAALICNSKDLRPTTAIKSLGISDPSTIRRLRDKFNAARKQLLAEAKAAAKARTKANSQTPEPPQPGAQDVSPSQTSQIPSAINDPQMVAAGAAQSCALKKPHDPRLFEPEFSEYSMATKKTTKTARSKKAKVATRASKRRTTKTGAPPRQPEIPATSEQDELQPLNLFGAWMILGAQVMTASARAQLEIIEAAQRSKWFHETQQFQKQALSTWLCTMSPQITFDDPLFFQPTTSKS